MSIVSLSRAWRRILLCGMAMFFAGAVYAESPRVVQLEEHWELRLGQPERDRSAPQTTMVVSPDGDLAGTHFLFALNHWTVPAYEPGGMQVQVWDGEQLLECSESEKVGALEHSNEVVRWVQQVTLEDGKLQFRVLGGESETWGAFGGDDLTVSAATSLTSLNAYKPGISIAESQVSYAENRVVSLTLTKLVWITDDGAVHEMSAPIAVDTSLSP